MKNEQLYKIALDAIKELYNDQSVSIEDAIVNLESLKEEIDVFLDTLQDTNKD